MAILLKRNAKVFVSLVDAGWTTGNTVRLNILDNFSYSQASISESQSRSTISSAGSRGLTSYVSDTAPAEFSFTTYLSTFSGSLQDSLLWTALTNKSDVSISVDFLSSDVAKLPELFIYFQTDTDSYKISTAIISAAQIDMNLDGIPTVTWTGSGASLVSSAIPSTFTDEFGSIPETLGKLTTLAMSRNSISYTAALTSFSLSIDNGVQWSSRKRLGEQSIPETYFTGDRVFTGSMSFYMNSGSNKTKELVSAIYLENIQANRTSDLYADTQVILGGAITLDMPKVLLEAPSIQQQEALVVDIPFIANASAGLDELTITF